MRFSGKFAEFDAARWLAQGISPQRLALTLALGFAIGCIPVVGIPTVLCATLAIILRLNQPAIQAANYAAMPLQILLIVPFMKLGKWVFGFGPSHPQASEWLTRVLVFSPAFYAIRLAGQALLGWMLIAVPAVGLLWLTLTPMLRQIPAIASAESGD